jgi:uncharacterized protein YjbJ (UPF0337 family)
MTARRVRPQNHVTDCEEITMSTDEAKGRIKEAAGDLTDDDDLKREGKVDKGVGRAKEMADEVGDKVKDTLKNDD